MAEYQSEPSQEDQVHMPDRAAWRAWLAENHDTRESIWLVFAKKQATTPSVDYESAVLEALCFGWIDSKVQAMDEERYRQYFSVRKPISTWTSLNKQRVAVLEEEGLMTSAGRNSIEAAKANGSWEFMDEVEAMVLPPDLAGALERHAGAREAYEQLSNTKKRGVLLWIKQAKREKTRIDRIAKVAEAASRGETPLSYL